MPFDDSTAVCRVVSLRHRLGAADLSPRKAYRLARDMVIWHATGQSGLDLPRRVTDGYFVVAWLSAHNLPSAARAARQWVCLDLPTLAP